MYEDGLRPVLKYAERNRVPVVSPLATVKDERSPVLYQMAPSQQTKYVKLLEMLSGDKNIIYVSTAKPDTDMDENLRPLLPSATSTVTYSKQLTANALSQKLNRSKDNIFIISCDDEFTVDEILAKLSSMQNNIVARGAAGLSISIVGNSRWARFRGNMDRDLYFKLKLCYVASTHSDRSDGRVKSFDTNYIKAYEALPSQYAYRGYDAAKLFVSAARTPGMNFTNKLNTSETPLLQMKYHFVSEGRGDTFVNDNWALVCYGSDYTIEVR